MLALFPLFLFAFVLCAPTIALAAEPALGAAFSQREAVAGVVGLAVFTLVRLLKEDVSWLPSVPAQWRGLLVIVLSYAGGAVQAVASGAPLSETLVNGSYALVAAVLVYAPLRALSPRWAGAANFIEEVAKEAAKQRAEKGEEPK